MEHLELFGAFERITPTKMNRIVRELRRLQNIQVGKNSDLTVVHTSGGVIIDRTPRIMTVDDKYKLDEVYNQSDYVRRLGDLRTGDIADLWRVRAVLKAIGDKPDRLYRLMWLINNADVSSSGHDLEGGWLTTAADVGFSYTKHNPTHGIPPPKRLIAQIGDIVILTEDDKDDITKDKDYRTLANIRHDAHFHKGTYQGGEPGAFLDGRIFFVDDPCPPDFVGYANPLIWVPGDMRGDPTKANTDTALDKEEINWRPCVPIPIYILFGEPANKADCADVVSHTLYIETSSPYKWWLRTEAEDPCEWVDVTPTGGGLESGVKVLFNTKGEKSGYDYDCNLCDFVPCRTPQAGDYALVPNIGGVVFQVSDSGEIYIAVGVTGPYPDFIYVDTAFRGIPDDIDCGTWEQETNVASATQGYDAAYGSLKFDYGTGLKWIGVKVGGWDSENLITRAAWVYYAETDTWEQAFDWPKIGTTITVGGILCFKGKNVFVAMDSAGNVYHLDWSAKSGWFWIPIGAVGSGPARIWAGSFTDAEGNWHIVAGHDGVEDLKDHWQLTTTGGWEELDVLPGIARRYPFAFFIDGFGYVGGGWNPEEGGILSDVYCWKEATETWINSTKPLPLPISHAYAIGTTTGEGYVIGGDTTTGTGTRLNTVFRKKLLVVYEKE